MTRMVHRGARLLLAFILVLALASPAFARVEQIGPIGFTVADMDRSITFFTKVLSFEKTSDAEVVGDAYEDLQGVFGVRMRVVQLRLGDESIELSEYLAPRGRPIPADSRSNDHWFQHVAIVVTDMSRAYRWLRQHNVEHASTGPQTLPPSIEPAAGIQAFYFKDPDGHPLELVQYPSDKGAAKWHRRTDKVFLGIDHTAVVVADTDASLRFYRDAVGLTVAGGSENFGTEQAHLNNVRDAHLRITTLRADQGPGIELLEYLNPRDGRAAPADLHANDLAHWQIRALAPAAELDTICRGATVISRGIVTLPAAELGFRRAVLVDDPDGHAVQLVQP